jgi:hypothetical protein
MGTPRLEMNKAEPSMKARIFSESVSAAVQLE